MNIYTIIIDKRIQISIYFSLSILVCVLIFFSPRVNKFNEKIFCHECHLQTIISLENIKGVVCFNETTLLLNKLILHKSNDYIELSIYDCQNIYKAIGECFIENICSIISSEENTTKLTCKYYFGSFNIEFCFNFSSKVNSIRLKSLIQLSNLDVKILFNCLKIFLK